jgi:hypothetical protein
MVIPRSVLFKVKNVSDKVVEKIKTHTFMFSKKIVTFMR